MGITTLLLGIGALSMLSKSVMDWILGSQQAGAQKELGEKQTKLALAAREQSRQQYQKQVAKERETQKKATKEALQSSKKAAFQQKQATQEEERWGAMAMMALQGLFGLSGLAGGMPQQGAAGGVAKAAQLGPLLDSLAEGDPQLRSELLQRAAAPPTSMPQALRRGGFSFEDITAPSAEETV